MWVRKQFPGGAAKTELVADITNSATAFDIVSTAGWPTGGNPWVVTIDRGMPNEESILCSSRTGATVSVTTRGYAGTPAMSHTAGATVECTWDAVTADEVNALATLLTAKGQLYVFDGTNLVAAPIPALDEVLAGDPATASGFKKVSRLVPLAASPPTQQDGGWYYDTTYDELRIGEGGQWKRASLGVVVFATTGDRDTLWGINGIAGYLAYVTATGRLYIGTGAGWIPVAKRGEWVELHANAAARDAALPSPSPGMVAYLADVDKLQVRRASNGGEWVTISRKMVVSSSAPNPSTMVDEDIWIQPLA